MMIKDIIKAQGWTISAIADKLNVSQQALSAQIAKSNKMSVERLTEIAHIINCPPSALLQDADEDNTLYITCPHCRKRIRICADDADQTASE